MSTSLDIAALRARLREYDPALPHCKQRITREQNYAPDFVPEEERAEWDMVTYVPCYRPEGHEGVCRNTRLVLGFPGYDTLTALLDEVERLREDVATFSDDFRRVTSETCAPDERHCSCVPHLRAEVEAARAEAVTMRTWAEEAAKAENENAEDARKERAAVVAWLRENESRVRPVAGAIISAAADCIERGDHRREEER